MVKIFIDPGHGGKDPGAVGLGLREKDLTLAISLKIRGILQKEYSDVEVRLSRTTDVFLSLGERARLANAWGADLLLSIHINATPSGYGYEDFIYNGKVSTTSVKVQNVINVEVVKATGWRNRGKKRGNLQVLRDSKMAALLTECGFIDNSNDAKLLKDDAFLDKIARGHVNGIAEAFNLKREIFAMDQPEKEEVRMFNPSSATLKNEFEQFLTDAVKKGTISDKWLKGYNAGKLTLDDALALKVTVDQRSK